MVSCSHATAYCSKIAVYVDSLDLKPTNSQYYDTLYKSPTQKDASESPNHGPFKTNCSSVHQIRVNPVSDFKSKLKYEEFHSRKCIEKCKCLQNWGNFVKTPMCLPPSLCVISSAKINNNLKALNVLCTKVSHITYMERISPPVYWPRLIIISDI